MPTKNSVRGVSVFERFSTDMGLHVMEVSAPARAAVRSNHVVGAGADAIRVLHVQGGIRFAGAERIVREVIDTAPAEARVAFDLSMVSSIDDVARRVLLEVVRRLTLDGHEVYLIDPESAIPEPDPGDGGRAAVVGDIDQVGDRACAVSDDTGFGGGT